MIRLLNFLYIVYMCDYTLNYIKIGKKFLLSTLFSVLKSQKLRLLDDFK